MKEETSTLKKIGISILSFLFPIVGIILFIAWHNKKPKLCISIVICTILGIIMGISGYNMYVHMA